MTFRQQWEAFTGKKWPAKKPTRQERVAALKVKGDLLISRQQALIQKMLKDQMSQVSGVIGGSMGAQSNYQNQLQNAYQPSAIGQTIGTTTTGGGITYWPNYPQQPFPQPPAQTCPITPDATTEARWWLQLLIQDHRLSPAAREKLRGCLGMLELAESAEGHP